VDEVDARSAPDALASLLERAHALVVRTYTRVDAALLASAPLLRVVGRAGVGIDNIDQSACAARRVQVVHTPGANADAVAEYVIALMLDALRPRPDVAGALSRAAWSDLRADSVAARELNERVVGVLGLGAVGSRVARLCNAFGCKTLYHDLRVIPTEQRYGAAPTTFARLLSAADVLTVHVDNRPGNRMLLDACALSALKPDALLINTSRGFVVDEQALAALLRARPEMRAALDVHEVEPVSPTSPLLELPNARLLPHIGAATKRAHLRMSQQAVEKVWRALQQPASDGG